MYQIIQKIIKTQLFLYILCLFIAPNLKAQRITIASACLSCETQLVTALEEAGYTVHIQEKYWDYLTTDGVLELMHNYDLVIISRETTSNRYGGAYAPLWQTVPIPVINMSGYINRAELMNFFNTGSTGDNLDSIMVAVQDTSAVFAGVELASENMTPTLSTGMYGGNAGMIDAGNGTVISTSTSSTGNVVTIAEWEAGVPFHNSVDISEAHAGKRMWFSGVKNPSAYNETGLKMLVNAVGYMIATSDYEPGDTVIIDPPIVMEADTIEAESFSVMDNVSIETIGDTSALQVTADGWAEYAIEGEAVNYTLTFKIKADSGRINVKEENVVIGNVKLPKNGETDWQNISIPVKFLSSGPKTIRLSFSGCNSLFRFDQFYIQEIPLGNSRIEYDANGRMTAFQINGENYFSSVNQVTLLEFDGVEVQESTMTASTSGDTVTFTADGGTPVLRFQIDNYPRHISIHLLDAKGVEGRNFGLRMPVKSSKSIEYKTLSDLVEYDSRNSAFEWPYLWGKEGENNYKGGVAIYKGGLEGEALDASLAEVWSTEKVMPRPGVREYWTESDVLNWVDEYADRYNNETRVQLEPKNLAELYSLVNNLVIPNKIKNVYLHCNIWRGEYWLKDLTYTHINTEIFPKGKEDFKAFVDYLHDNNVTIGLHNLTYNIGIRDPDYILGKVDRRLASWGAGTLEDSINASDVRIMFRPEPGQSGLPFMGSKAHAGNNMLFNCVRVGEEIIKVGTFIQTDKDVWILSECTRGYGGISAIAHDAGEEIVGLYHPYNKAYVPEFDMDKENSLANEYALKYADFVMEMELDHLHYDGSAIISFYSPWSMRPYFSKTYSHVSRPVTTSQVGRKIAANFELAFSKCKDDKSYAYFSLDVGLRTDEISDHLSTSFYDTHYHATECIGIGARRVNLVAVNHSAGISQAILDNHGLADTVQTLFRYLQELAPVFHNDDVNYLLGSMFKQSGSNHLHSYDVQILSKNEAGDYIYIPHHVMGQTSGVDEPWKIDQEEGAVPRKQVISSGMSLELTNPKSEQNLNFILRIAKGSPENISILLSNGGYINISGAVSPGEYLSYYDGDTAVTVFDNNWNPLRTLSISSIQNFKVPQGDNTITVNISATATIETQFITIGEAYRLKTNDVLNSN